MKFCLKPGYTASSAGQVPKLPLKIYLCATHKFNCVFQVLRRRCCCCCPCSFRSTINSLFKHCSLSLRWRGEMAKKQWKTEHQGMRWNEEMKFSLSPAPQVFEKVSHFDCVFPYIKQGLGVLGHAPLARYPSDPSARCPRILGPTSLWSAHSGGSGFWLLAPGCWLLASTTPPVTRILAHLAL